MVERREQIFIQQLPLAWLQFSQKHADFSLNEFLDRGEKTEEGGKEKGYYPIVRTVRAA